MKPDMHLFDMQHNYGSRNYRRASSSSCHTAMLAAAPAGRSGRVPPSGVWGHPWRGPTSICPLRFNETRN
jgi:hypothetical protein